MINKNSDFDELLETYLQRMALLCNNTRNMTENFYKKLDKNIVRNFFAENKLVAKKDKYELKRVKKEIRAEYGWLARLKRWLRFDRHTAKQANADEPAKVEKISEEQAKLENENKQLKLQLEQATNNYLTLQQQLQLQKVDSIEYED